MNIPDFGIAAVERDTGLSKDVLRVWERRYGFPAPCRDANGERSYPAEQVERLRLIKRLMDQGHRPGKLIATATEELSGLAGRSLVPRAAGENGEVEQLGALLALIKQRDGAAYQQAMQQRLARQGLQRFVQDSVAPLTRRVGEAWEDGSFEIFDEHLFTELTKRLLRQAIATLPVGRSRPRILLTSVPDEQHVLGLLMAEALFALEGADCIPLGAQMPLLEIGRAASAHRTDIVALSFSVAFPQRQIAVLLQQLRMVLPPEAALWAGGAGIQRLVKLDGVDLLPTFDMALAALADWRAAHP
ncbi:MAG: MerR family transcriptional regulator [Candidatus Accumulibacter phosphatis]|jgi:DNA-binding transcriptional MerR regulator/methylmalonyl-CoA mutase cobalamin-binding subunit|uniref:MerR family transcriptional regulator n=2 Tax=Candidatus Accumulibacter TaxID=327159 RepID=A0ABX1T6V8_9PROT|nr:MULTISPECIES: MerR family transcriptional regulator [Candidatus Accumulibacter]KFB71709.1 MAG: putative cobalamin binding protein [Candidatus Accumulibacter phosphatis]MBL8409040.1 MerR family transcriptional regulator [Accumulibacter sp.]NMQ04128.1 MerR family transcriptional regulator [Candidatus Accumulibacter contiguus]